MIKIENFEVLGWEHAIRGMRNPMNSWDKGDSTMIGTTLKNEEVCPGVEALVPVQCTPYLKIGPNDLALMEKLSKAGSDHRKFMRMIDVYLDITAPLYWWKEFDTYKVGTVANSCSTMHKIHAKEFTLKDFSYEHLLCIYDEHGTVLGVAVDVSPFMDGSNEFSPLGHMDNTIRLLNICRDKFLETKDKKYWWQMIQLLPSSYNQKRTVKLNYEVLANVYTSRKNHKLDEWIEFCKWIETLPYSEIITGKETTDE